MKVYCSDWCNKKTEWLVARKSFGGTSRDREHSGKKSQRRKAEKSGDTEKKQEVQDGSEVMPHGRM